MLKQSVVCASEWYPLNSWLNDLDDFTCGFRQELDCILYTSVYPLSFSDTRNQRKGPWTHMECHSPWTVQVARLPEVAQEDALVEPRTRTTGTAESIWIWGGCSSSASANCKPPTDAIDSGHFRTLESFLALFCRVPYNPKLAGGTETVRVAVFGDFRSFSNPLVHWLIFPNPHIGLYSSRRASLLVLAAADAVEAAWIWMSG